MRRALRFVIPALAVLGLAACSDHVTGVAPVVLPAPTTLTSTSLNGAISLSWADNAYLSDPADFDHYRVYSTSYDLDSNLCGIKWDLEGTTVSPAFIAGALNNGVPRCFAVSAISTTGDESSWSPFRNDTPRADAQAVVVYTAAANSTTDAFQFWLDANGNRVVDPGELGVVASTGSLTSADFTVVTFGAGLGIKPGPRAKVQVVSPVDNLTDIDFAPATGYDTATTAAQVRTGYIFEIDPGDGFFRYGALHVSVVGPNFIVFDWSYQQDPGNPELLKVRPVTAGQ